MPGASLPIGLGGLSALMGWGGGLYWLVPGVVVALSGGVINSWILLIEILRWSGLRGHDHLVHVCEQSAPKA